MAAARDPECDLLRAAGRGGLAASPKRFSAQNHGYRWFAWRDTGLFETHQSPARHGRPRAGRTRGLAQRRRARQPSVKTTESGGPRGYDAGKKVKGRKRQVMVDTDGRGLILDPSPPTFRIGTARRSCCACRGARSRSSPKPSRIWALPESGPRAPPAITIEVVRKPADQVGFAVHPRRWVVERFFAWISRNRRLWKDPEATLASARAFLYAASVMLLTRRLARLS